MEDRDPANRYAQTQLVHTTAVVSLATCYPHLEKRATVRTHSNDVPL